MNHSNTDDLIAMLIQLRAERKLSQAAVAKAIRVSQGAIAKYERGAAKPRKTTAIRLTEFLNKHGYFPKMETAA